MITQYIHTHTQKHHGFQVHYSKWIRDLLAERATRCQMPYISRLLCQNSEQTVLHSEIFHSLSQIRNANQIFQLFNLIILIENIG